MHAAKGMSAKIDSSTYATFASWDTYGAVRYIADICSVSLLFIFWCNLALVAAAFNYVIVNIF